MHQYPCVNRPPKHTYHNVGEQEDMGDAPREVPVPLQVVLLVRPLGDDPQRIFEERDNDEEATESRQVRLDGLGVLIDEIFDFGRVLAHLVQWILRRIHTAEAGVGT